MSDAPKVIYLHHADLVKNDGTQCLVFTSPAPVNFTNHQSRYHHDDTVTALQAENTRLRAACEASLPLMQAADREEVTDVADWHAAEALLHAALKQET